MVIQGEAVILETERTRLREMCEGDLDFVAEMLADPEVTRFYPKQYSREESAEWLQRQIGRYQTDGFGLWLVEQRETGEPLGQIGVLRQEVEGDLLLEVGYLVHRPYWQQGYASEAAAACRDYAFETLQAEMVYSLIRPVNIPSQRVALKNGFKPLRLVDFKGIEHLLFGIPRTSRRFTGEF